MNIGVKPDEQTKLYDEIGKLTGWEREQTNKEWIQSATTEQLLAEILLNATQKCKRCASGIGIEDDDMTCPFGGCWDVKDVVEWLKEIHKDS